MYMKSSSQRELIVVHSSDLHLGTDSAFEGQGSDPMCALRRVLAVAGEERADLVLLAGDTFDHNRQPAEVIEQTVRVMGAFDAPIVILPGNHDPLTPDSVYRRPEFVTPANVSVMGLTVNQRADFPLLGLEVWGRAHVDYADMWPLCEPCPRSMRWRLAVAHGHYVDEPHQPGRLLGSWLIRDADLSAADADYIALGHWNRPARVGNGGTRAYYSGCPDFAGTVNVVRFRSEGSVEVVRTPVPAPAKSLSIEVVAG
jgi:DNA repair exonuclease SbcCD nuclease subunit